MVYHLSTRVSCQSSRVISFQCYDRIITRGTRHLKLVDIMWPERENDKRILQL